MLPLWIIDLNRDQNTCDFLRSRIADLQGTNENWRYTTYSDIDFESETWFKDFVQELVSTGQRAIRELKSVKPINDCCMNVCVIGDATEEFTLKFFSSVAAIIKKEKGRIIPGHIHQGINILGILYVPSDIHNKDFSLRQSVLRCLKELDVQHRINLAAGYDRVMLYQDTQRRTAKYYPLLTYEQRMDYLLQCLIHLYYVCDATHPLLDANGGDDDFFFSIGVGSLYYDTNEQDEKDLRLVANSIFSSIQEKGTVDSKDQDISIFDLRTVSTQKLFDTLQITYHDVPSFANLGLDPPGKHPIGDFLNRYLLRVYYNQYLRFYPTKLLNKIIEAVTANTKNTLEQLNTRMHDYYVQIAASLRNNIRTIFSVKISPEVGCITLIQSKLSALRESLTTIRKNVDEDAEIFLWNEIMENRIPDRLKDDFEEYHKLFTEDEASASSNENLCEEKKAETTEKLAGMMSRESTMASTLARVYLAGIIVILAIMPVLEVLSPNVINLGNVKKWSFIWAGFIFLVPGIIEYIKVLRYRHKKRRLSYKLMAYYVHDSYARLVNRAKNQVFSFFDDMDSLCVEYDKRCNVLLEEKEILDDSHVYTLEIPQTMFNQPVIDGECCGRPLFYGAEMNRNSLNIRGSVVRVDKLNKKQKYTVVSAFPDLFMMLFDGVHKYEKEYRDTVTREAICLTDDEVQAAREKAWAEAKVEFHKEFVDQVKTIFIERSDNTIAQKLTLLARDPANQNGFKLFSAFCETNGEFTSNDDKDFAILKTSNQAMIRSFAKYLPPFTAYSQENDDDMYRSFIFLTRWKTFDHISPNRILPEIELYDKDVFDTEKWAKPPKSSLLLYALMGNMSAEWYSLFSPRALLDVPAASKAYKDELNRRK